MALKKTYLKSGTCKVTFELPADAAGDAAEVYLVGDFNGWNKGDEALKMTKKKSGAFSVTAELDRGKEYQFRYLIDGTRWENDWAADRYVGTPYSSTENSVVVIDSDE
jgi:1,4-alpha-glucan branching enzyme